MLVTSAAGQILVDRPSSMNGPAVAMTWRRKRPGRIGIRLPSPDRSSVPRCSLSCVSSRFERRALLDHRVRRRVRHVTFCLPRIISMPPSFQRLPITFSRRADLHSRIHELPRDARRARARNPRPVAARPSVTSRASGPERDLSIWPRLRDHRRARAQLRTMLELRRMAKSASTFAPSARWPISPRMFRTAVTPIPETSRCALRCPHRRDRASSKGLGTNHVLFGSRSIGTLCQISSVMNGMNRMQQAQQLLEHDEHRRDRAGARFFLIGRGR